MDRQLKCHGRQAGRQGGKKKKACSEEMLQLSEISIKMKKAFFFGNKEKFSDTT